MTEPHSDPPDLRQAVAWHRDGAYDKAVTAYRALLRETPDSALIWTNLGAALRSLGHLQAAKICHRRALHHGPGHPTAIANLGNALREEGNFEEARRMALIERSGLAGGPVETLARDLQAIGQWRASLAAFDAAIADSPADAELRTLRAASRFMVEDFAGGLEDYGQRFRYSPRSEPTRPSPRWRGGPAKGRRLLVMAEQGLGDLVLVSRFLPLLRDQWAEIWLTSRSPTRRLFEQVPYIDRVFTREAPPPDGAEDAYVPAMDLMRIFALTPQNCPPPAPLHIPADSRRRAAQLTAPYGAMLKVGIAWAGSAGFAQAKRKATDLAQFLDLAAIPGVQLFGMCKGAREADIAALGADALILNTAATDRDLADAAALCDAMDVVVTVDTGLAHVAGALGVPVWVLLARPAFWYWGAAGATSYWYPSMRLIRQTNPGDWSGPFATVRADLEGMVL